MQRQDNLPQQQLNFALVGDRKVGKTAIFTKYKTQLPVSDSSIYDQSLTVDFHSRYFEIKDTPVKIMLWDMPGLNKKTFLPDTKITDPMNYLNYSAVILLIFTGEEKESLQHVKDFYSQFSKNHSVSEKPIYYALVMNKVDATQNNKLKDDAEDFAHVNEMAFFTISATNKSSIDSMFQQLAEKPLEDRQRAEKKNLIAEIQANQQALQDFLTERLGKSFIDNKEGREKKSFFENLAKENSNFLKSDAGESFTLENLTLQKLLLKNSEIKKNIEAAKEIAKKHTQGLSSTKWTSRIIGFFKANWARDTESYKKFKDYFDEKNNSRLRK